MSNPIRPIDALDQLRQLGLSFAVSHAFFAGCKLGIFDALADAPATPDELGARLGVHPEGLKRLLVVLHRVELLEREGERFQLSALGRFARSDDPYGMDGLSKIEKFVRMWEFLPESVQKHGPVWEEAFGASSEEIFVELYADPEELRRFCDYMDSYSLAIGEQIATRYDFTRHRCLMDVAGGPGGLSRQIARRHPHLQGIVMDLPEVLEVAKERIQRDGLADRFRTETADLFEGPYPKGADVLTLSWILHDWNDEKCARILGHCYDVLPPGGVLLISEMVMNEDYSGSSLWSEIYSLFMLVVCESEGRERPESEHRALLAGAGFDDVEILRDTGPRDLIIARKS